MKKRHGTLMRNATLMRTPMVRSLTVRLLAAVSSSLVTTTAFGEATVDPSTEPFLTLAPYVLKSSNLEPRIGNEQGGTRAYRPWFESGSWTGDLIEYEITHDGVRVVRGDIGRYPRDGANWRGTQELWSARYAFPDYQHYDQSQELDENWQCQEENPDYWQSRNVYTYSNGARVPLLWDRLTVAQRQVLDAATAADGNVDHDNEPYASDILNFVRGDRSNERCKDDGTYRWRFSVLGAIVNSLPVYVPAGSDGLVVVGANDGMLHGFSAADGTELFGYVPSMLLNRVGALRISPYRPAHFVDGELRHRDIGSSSNPQHIVAGGLGAGGKGLFVLDVTTPGAPVVVAELSGTNATHIGGSYDSRIGHIHGRPTIARLDDGTSSGRWYVVAGNGYASDADSAQLVLVPIDGGSPEFIVADATPGNGLSAPALVDATGNGMVDYAYAGDLQGNLWRFDLDARSVTRLFSAGTGKPITVEPDIGRHPDAQPGFMVYFGTGSLLSAADVQNAEQQTIYGIWDRGDGATVAESSLVSQALVNRTISWPVPQVGNACIDVDGENSEATVRFIGSQQTPVWTGTDRNLGWRVDLPRTGERLIGRPQIRASRIQFVTTNPHDMVDLDRAEDTGSGSWILQLDLASGGNAAEPAALFDLNKNCVLDAADGAPDGFTTGDYTIAAGTFPVGVNLGPHHIAQPAFARVRFNEALRSVVDGVYINALQIPPMDSTGLTTGPPHGPLDVTTDSPFGPARAGANPEPAKEASGGRAVPRASGPTKPFIVADGLGHRVDGHSFGYNRHHGVDYVDFFELEPRWGLQRLDIGAVYYDGSNYEPITPRISERELNRVTDVGIGTEQRFIVMVTNADLSRENEIQIGCRRWPVYEYQTMMMDILRRSEADMMAALSANDLIFTLSGDYNPIRPSSGGADCSTPTLRITPTQRVGSLDATMATLPGCVNNTDHYQITSGNQRHQTLKSGLRHDGTFQGNAGPEDLYATDSHVTPNREGTGYRWRNGALTVQLLAVDSNTPLFTLQPEAELPRGNGVEGEDMGWGGAYARGFTVSGNTIVPWNDGNPANIADAETHGFLYELSMFWHWGDMTRFQQEGGGSPVTPYCYGSRSNTGPALMYETDWFTPGAYSSLTSGLDDAVQQEYVALLAQLRSPLEADVEAALARLQELFDEYAGLADYHRLRHYVPNSRQLQEHHLIAIDRGGLGEVAIDGTPADVMDIERDLLPSLGPNYRPGRRSWIDLSPEE